MRSFGGYVDLDPSHDPFLDHDGLLALSFLFLFAVLDLYSDLFPAPDLSLVVYFLLLPFAFTFPLPISFSLPVMFFLSLAMLHMISLFTWLAGRSFVIVVVNLRFLLGLIPSVFLSFCALLLSTRCSRC